MSELSLEDIVPVKGSFSLKSTGNTYTLRMFSLADEAWAVRTWGKDGWQKVFRDMDMVQICRLVYQLLENECKKDFMKKSYEFVDEKGNSVTMELGGVDALIALVCGEQEHVAMLQALMQSRGITPKAAEAVSQMDESKKKMSESTGEGSSTSSDMNTGGQLNIA